MKKSLQITILLLVSLILSACFFNDVPTAQGPTQLIPEDQNDEPSAYEEVSNKEAETEEAAQESTPLFQMSIEALRQKDYSGGEFVTEETLVNGTNYQQFVVSYRSEGLKIYGLLTVPLAERPETGFPAIVFIHGYIPPNQYSTTENYSTYQAALARAGFITFKPDLRGHGNSEGESVSSHYSEKYVVDTLNALAYLKDFKDTDPNRIGYWGHSNGGSIGLRAILVDEDIQAASLWAGVVGSYEAMFETRVDEIPFLEQDNPLTQLHGLPSAGGRFWQQTEPYFYLDEITVPIELQHGTGDASVPIELSQELKEALEAEGKTVEYFEYSRDDHNISKNVDQAWKRSIEFFKEHL